MEHQKRQRITEKLYKEIKPLLKTSKDDDKVMKRYNIGQTTARAIRRSVNWTDYRVKTVKMINREPVNIYAVERSLEKEVRIARKRANKIQYVLLVLTVMLAVAVIAWFAVR